MKKKVSLAHVIMPRAKGTVLEGLDNLHPHRVPG